MNGPPLLWERTTGSGYSGPAVVGGRVFLMDRLAEPHELGKVEGNPNFVRAEIAGKERVRAFDAKTGEPLWEHVYDCPYSSVALYAIGPRCTPTVDGERIYTLGAEGHLFCLNAKTGELISTELSPDGYKEISRAKLIDPTHKVSGRMLVWSAPAFANRKVYLRNDKVIRCYDLSAPSDDIPLAKPEEVGMSAEGLGKVSAAIQKRIEDKEIAGAVTIVARRGKVVHFDAQGMQDIAAGKPMQKETIFRIYSMTKAVVSVAAMILVEEGKLELDVPASNYIPALGKMKVKGKPQEREMTLRDLLRHSAGFPNNSMTDRALRMANHPSLAESTLEEMMNRMEVVPLGYQPGQGWHYSFASDVVARLVEIVSGQSIDEFLEDRVFEPLGMDDTAFKCPEEKWDRFVIPYGRGLKPIDAPQPGTSGPFKFADIPKFLSGGGGLVSTAGDYMRFCLMLSGKGEFAGKRLLKKETVEAMTRDQLPDGVGEITRRPEGRGFGLGFAVRIRELDDNPSTLGEYEWLGGLGTEFFVAPSEDLVVITMSNQSPMISLKDIVRPLVYEAIVEDGSAGAVVPERERFLVLDSRIIERVDNAHLMPGTVEKSSSNPLLIEDQAWEARFDNLYPNVLYDEEEGIYKCWYCPFIIDQRTTETPPTERHPAVHDYMSKKPNAREEALLYATSEDGIHWKKPQLGVVEFQGSRENNIVCRGLGGSGVIKDRRDPEPERRYKAFYCTDSGYKMRYSRDGLRWGSEVDLPGVGQSDTHANMTWSPQLDKYVGILRHYDPVPITGNRKIARTESSDAVTWTKSKTILEGTPLKQLHDMTIFRDGGVYLGLLGCMNYPSEKSRHGVRQHVELAWSPDSYIWHRIAEGVPLIDHTPKEERKYGAMPYDWGEIFPSRPIIREDGIRIYYGASDWYFFDWRKGGLAMATLRKDGWAGYQPVDDEKPATVTTKPVRWKAGILRLSADVSNGGSIVITLLDENNQQLAISKAVAETATDAEISWTESFSAESLTGRSVRLLFELRGAKLYSFSFAE